MDRSALQRRRVVVGVGGGIAAYKTCELVRELMRAGADVRVTLTQAAQAFVTPLTFQALTNHPVLTDCFDPAQEAAFGHIELARWAELFVVAPATADLVARIRAGMGNDAVTTTLLAYRGTVLLAPAMNAAMFEHPATQENLRALAALPRYRTVGPEAGLLACGEVGAGRLAEVSVLVDACADLIGQGPLRGKRVLVSAGPTREPLDPVRFISNPSTGTMGLALARAARARGAQVTVVLGPVGEVDRSGLEVVDVGTAEEMAAAVMDRVTGVDYFVSAAAVSDYRPRTTSAEKVKKGEGGEQLELVRTPDILLQASQKVREVGGHTVLVGFAAETERVEQHAWDKLVRKKLDFIVANDITRPGAGFGTQTNHVFCLARDGARHELSGTKVEVAARLWDVFLEQRGSAVPPT